MNNLNSGVEELTTAVCNKILNHTALHSVVKECLRTQNDTSISKEDTSAVLREAAEHFRAKSMEKMKALIEKTEIEERLQELKKLVAISEDENEELGIDAGYRSIEPEEDLAGVISTNIEGYQEVLDQQNLILEEVIKKKRVELAERTAAVMKLSQLLEGRMKRQN